MRWMGSLDAAIAYVHGTLHCLDRPLPATRQPQYVQDCTSSPTWPQEAQCFHATTLQPKQETVRSHFSHPHVFYAGSYEGCGCGFNYGREYPEAEDDAEHLTAARESVGELLRFGAVRLGKLNIQEEGLGNRRSPIVSALNCLRERVRSFGVFTSDLIALRDWLKRCQIQTIAMELSGVYWSAIF